MGSKRLVVGVIAVSLMVMMAVTTFALDDGSTGTDDSTADQGTGDVTTGQTTDTTSGTDDGTADQGTGDVTTDTSGDVTTQATDTTGQEATTGSVSSQNTINQGTNSSFDDSFLQAIIFSQLFNNNVNGSGNIFGNNNNLANLFLISSLSNSGSGSGSGSGGMFGGGNNNIANMILISNLINNNNNVGGSGSGSGSGGMFGGGNSMNNLLLISMLSNGGSGGLFGGSSSGSNNGMSSIKHLVAIDAFINGDIDDFDLVLERKVGQVTEVD